MKNTMVIKNELNVVDYVSMVNGIVSEFFDDEGEYVPHIGRINAMRLFYNKCVLDSKFDLPHNFNDALQIDILVEDEEFIKAFNDAVKGDGMVRLDFANAYADAIEIVKTRKGTLGNAVNYIKKVLTNTISSITSELGEDGLEKLKELSDNFAGSNIDADAIVKAFGNSQRFKDIISNE